MKKSRASTDRKQPKAGCAAAADVRSLASFAKANPRNNGGRECWTCSMKPSVLNQVHKAAAEKVAFSVIFDWLVTQGFKGAYNTLLNHFRSRHHERGVR